MKTINQIINELKEAESILGFDPVGVEQGTENWHKMRMGLITASNAEYVLAGKKTQSRRGYINELIGQICTGQREDISSKPMQWGKDNEEAATSALEVILRSDGVKIPFIFKDKNLRAGCSPDLLFEDSGAEVKCPFATKTHIDFIRDKYMKPEYVAQVQFSMWVTERDNWFFCSFDPRMKVKAFDYVPVMRDEELMKKFDDLVPEVIAEIDLALKGVGIAFGAQWRKE